ncbi:hypothetical protein [Azospirillum endophyticum]
MPIDKAVLITDPVAAEAMKTHRANALEQPDDVDVNEIVVHPTASS